MFMHTGMVEAASTLYLALVKAPAAARKSYGSSCGAVDTEALQSQSAAGGSLAHSCHGELPYANEPLPSEAAGKLSFELSN